MKTDIAIADTPATTPLSYTINGVCDATDSGRTKVHEWIKERRLRAKRLDGRTIVLAEDLKSFLADLPDAQPQAKAAAIAAAKAARAVGKAAA